MIAIELPSMVNPAHQEWLKEAVRDVNKNHIEGALVECGVWQGGTIMSMMDAQKQCEEERDVYLYDTFNGMTEPSLKDSAYDRSKFKKRGNKWCAASLDLVKNNISEIGYNEDKTHYIVGDVLKTLDIPDNIPEKIAVLRLDTDFYDSTKKELDVLFPRLSVGGYLIIDDYWAHRGCRVATLEFLENNHDKLECITPRAGNAKLKRPDAAKKYRLSYKRLHQ